MINLNKHFCYWIEKKEGIIRHAYGCYYIDDFNEDDEKIINSQQSGFYRDNINLSLYNKLHIYDAVDYSGLPEENKAEHLWELYGDDKYSNVLSEGSYKVNNIMNYICILQRDASDWNEAEAFGQFFLIPKNVDCKAVAEKIVDLYKGRKIDTSRPTQYIEIYRELQRAIENSIFIIGYGMTSVTMYKKLPPYVGMVVTCDVFTDMEYDIPAEYAADENWKEGIIVG